MGADIPLVSGIDGASLQLVWVLPFVGMLASIALFPLLALVPGSAIRGR
jgi:hypothetical protein